MLAFKTLLEFTIYLVSPYLAKAQNDRCKIWRCFIDVKRKMAEMYADTLLVDCSNKAKQSLN